MDIFASRTLTWYEVGAIKLSVLLIGIAIGAYWPETFLPYLTLIVIVGIAAGLYASYAWFTKQP